MEKKVLEWETVPGPFSTHRPVQRNEPLQKAP